MNMPLTQESRQLLTQLQSFGLRLADPGAAAHAGVASRRGGAGPSDHKAVTIDGHTIMVPVHTGPAHRSPFIVEGQSLKRASVPIAQIAFPKAPRFYALQTLDGVPYSHIATLHGADVLATTVLQTCIRYESRRKACKFCAIGQSLAAGRTIAHKTPQQLAEVARAAVLAESARAIKAAVDLPIQGQCEPPDDDRWFELLHAAGIDTLGMHLEVVTPSVREHIMPGKAQVPVSRYLTAFEAAVRVFGRGQVSTYILAGLGDTREAILETSEQLLALGVYPFVVPFVPISGTPLEDHAPPTPEFMRSLLEPLGAMLAAAGLRSGDIKAGCGKCGACSSLSVYER
jgi:biotin synthase-related radical SAM superfamily protein